jgi:Sulfotransferase family
MKDKIFLFVGGLHKSGTSLVHEILRDHPEISGFHNTGVSEDEGQHLQSVYPPAKTFGGPGRFGFDARSFMDQNHPLITTANAERLYSQWSRHWDLHRNYLLEKSPPNLVRTRFLQKIFPRSMFVIIFRHPIAVAYATKKWSRTSIRSLIEHSFVCYERFLADLPYLNRCFVLRYEEFVLNPQETINRIYDFIGLKPVVIDKKVDPNVNDKYVEMWRKDNARWMAGFFRRIPADWDDRARRLGYSLNQPAELVPVSFLGEHKIQSPVI